MLLCFVEDGLHVRQMVITQKNVNIDLMDACCVYISVQVVYVNSETFWSCAQEINTPTWTSR